MIVRRPFLVFVAVLVCLLGTGVLAGCGDDEEDTATETVTTAATESTPSTEAETKTGTATATVQDVIPMNRGPKYFETPSSNIGCYLDARAVRCDIRERNWDPPPEDDDCELDYGQGIALSASGEADFVCAGDTTLGGPATLGYGKVAQRRGLRCRSGRNGVTCTELVSGHGFFLSRESYRIF